VKEKELQVLLVDDSAVARQLVTSVLASEPSLSVSVAADPVIAIAKMRQSRPDVILLDLELPRLDGLSFLRRIMAEDPIPVVICSALASRGTELAFRALEEGAVGIVPKPNWRDDAQREAWARELVRTLREAVHARVRRALAASTRRAPLADADAEGRAAAAKRAAKTPLRGIAAAELASRSIVAIGASTGGPDALRRVLDEMPADSPAVVIAQHMPVAFTGALARHLDAHCPMEVREATDGERLVQGVVLIAPGDRHLVVLRTGGQFSVSLLDGPKVAGHRPSVDVLLRSVARAAGSNAVGIVLTGMGSDGAEGLLAMRRAGALTIAQDEETSMVFGMPREAAARGAAQCILPLDRIGAAALTPIRGRSG
jgi:two-component system chemotaxis response regulator CheB